MVAPVHGMKKNEIVWLATHYCVHRSPFLIHYSCYLREHPDREKIGFLDVEASNLDADFGIILSYCIKELDGPILGEVISESDILWGARAGHEDKHLVKKLVDDLQGFDRIVTYYGKRFDVPYIRARALSNGLTFPNYGTLKHLDLYDVVKSKLKISSRRQANVAQLVLGKTDKTAVEAKYWRGGQRGDAKSLKYVFEHNRIDVMELEALYKKLLPFFRKTDTSI